MIAAFLRAVLPAEGRYALWLGRNKATYWYTNIDAMATAVEEKTRLDNEVDLYYATASFDDAGKRTKEHVKLRRVLQLDIDAGADKHRRDPEGTYPGVEDAASALKRFARNTGLEPSMVVYSGMGLHVYFLLDTDILPNDWVLLAKRLETTCKRELLHVDKSVTTDSARLLRPIGSRHNNTNIVKLAFKGERTYSLEELDTLLDPLPAAAAAAPALSLGQAPSYLKNRSAINEAVMVKGPDRNMYKVAERCQAIGHIAETGGNVPEPAWRAMLGVAKHCVNGRTAAHEFSSGYAGYSAEETDEKMDRWTMGPSTCAEFDRTLAKCDGCEYRGKVKSPIMLGEVAVGEAPPARDDSGGDSPWGACDDDEGEPESDSFSAGLARLMPEGFSVRTSGEHRYLYGTVTLAKPNSSGDIVETEVKVPITRDICWVSGWSESLYTGDVATATLGTLVNGVEREYEFEQTLLADDRMLLRLLASHSVLLEPGAQPKKLIVDYLKAQIALIRSVGRREKVTKRFGPRFDANGRLIIAHGALVIDAEGNVSRGAVGTTLRDAADNGYIVRGLPPSPDHTWTGAEALEHILPRAKRYAEFIRRHYTGGRNNGRFQAAMQLALGSPLLAYTNEPYLDGDKLPAGGIVVSLMSVASGSGKTSAARVALGMFGKPANLLIGGDDGSATTNARMALAETSGTMPIGLDEVGKSDPQTFLTLVRNLANGAAKARLTQRSELIAPQKFAITSLMTTNQSLVSMVDMHDSDSAAIQARLIEFVVDDTEASNADAMVAFDQEFSDMVTDAAGSVGFLLHYAMVRAGAPLLASLVRKEIADMDKAYTDNRTNRFQWRALAASRVAVRLLENVGVHIFDAEAVNAAFDEAFHASLAASHAAAERLLPHVMLNNFLIAIRRETIVTDTLKPMVKMDGTVRPELVALGYDNGRLPAVLSARHIRAEKRTFVSRDRFNEWASKSGMSPRAAFSSVRDSGLLVAGLGYSKREPYTDKRDILVGMAESTGTRVRGFWIDMAKLQHALDETTPAALNDAPAPGVPHASPPLSLQ